MFHILGMHDLHIGAIDANLLVALDAILTEGSVTAAGVRLGLSQSATSHKLRRLRTLLGDELLVPVQGRLMPTPRAEAIRIPLRHAVAAMSDVLRVESFDPQQATRTNAIISTDYAEIVIIPTVLSKLGALAPGISTVLLQSRDDNAQRLARGEANVAVGGPMEGPGLRRRPLYQETMLCAVRSDHPVVRDTLDLDTWLQLGHVVFNRHPVPPLIDNVLAERGLTRRVVVTTPHLVGGPLIAARTDLVFTGLSGPVRELAKLLPLRLFPAPLPLPAKRLAVFMTWHERFDRDPGARWLREFTADVTLDVVGALGLPPIAPRQ